MDLSVEYSLQKYLQHAGYPKFKKSTQVYEAGCPICREGSSWGKKRRSYYVLKENIICCHNCGWYGSPYKWLVEVSQMTKDEIIAEEKELYGTTTITDIVEMLRDTSLQPSENTATLPHDSINMFDTHQLRYHKSNQTIKACLDLISSRRLDTAVNRPKTLWCSTSDYIHKDRLIIPFYDCDNNICYYQSRSIMNESKGPKYLSKCNSDKTLFNINRVSAESDNIYILEGPIDSFFLKNSVAIAGIQENSSHLFTSKQKAQISKFPFFKHIWVLDSQWQDQASMSKTKKLINQNQHVFIWPKDIGTQYKDLNDLCMRYSLDQIDERFIVSNTYTGLKAKLMLNQH